MTSPATDTSRSITGVVAVQISADKLTASVTVTQELAARPDAIDVIRAECSRLGIQASIDTEALSAAISSVSASGQEAPGVVIARGTAPTEPVDARLEWTKEFFASGYFVDPVTKCIDYHRKAATPSIDKDEVIAVSYPPQAGKEGRDLFGSAIPPVKPKPREHRPGINVVFDEESGKFTATSNGRVKLDGKVIIVADVYQLPNGVGTASGNIDHRGSVVINGGVESEFKVAASGDVDVRDLIGAADIECGGNLTAHKGISSGPGKKVVVKGSIHAKYLEHVLVLCEGDVVVETEILDSSVRAAGKVVSSGRVQGGDVMATIGLEVDEVGAHTESRTTLIAGIDYRVVNEQRECNESAKKIKEGLPKLQAEVHKLERLGSHLNPKQREVLTELNFKQSEAQAAYDELTERRKKLAVQMQAHRDATIVIKKRVNAGTMLRICDAHYEVRDTLLGPLTARLDPITKEIVLTT